MFWHVFGKISSKFRGILWILGDFADLLEICISTTAQNSRSPVLACALNMVGTCLNSVCLFVCLLRFIFYFIIYIFRKISMPLSVLIHILLYARDFKTFVQNLCFLHYTYTTPYPIQPILKHRSSTPSPMGVWFQVNLWKWYIHTYIHNREKLK